MNKIDQHSCKHIILLMCDHFEPSRYDKENAAVKVAEWCEEYASAASIHTDSDGVHPKHSWFYRFDYPNNNCLDIITHKCFESFGEIEFHLHHGYDTTSDFSRKIDEGIDWFQSFGAMISASKSPTTNFAYIAGNWALDNGRKDPRFSGVDNEISILSKYNCYADFTFPAFGINSQPRICNEIYHVCDNGKAKSYNNGLISRVGFDEDYDLTIFQGGLYIDWANAIIEYSAYESFSPYFEGREEYWIKSNIHVKGQPDWIFVKLHTHGMQSKSVFKHDVLDKLFSKIENKYKSKKLNLHYVTAREAYNLVKAAEDGKTGNPNEYRDYLIPPPVNTLIYVNTRWKLMSFSACEIEIRILKPIVETIIKLRFHGLKLIKGRNIRSLNIQYADGKVIVDADSDDEITLHYSEK